MQTLMMMVSAVRHGVLVLVVADIKAEHVGRLSVVVAAPLKLESGWEKWVAGLFAHRHPLVNALVRVRPFLGDGEGGP